MASGGLSPVRRNKSFEFIRPDSSESRSVSSGGSCSQRSSVGNFILGDDGFNKDPKPFSRRCGQVEKKQITVINTSDSMFPTADSMTEFLRECARLSGPGPHVFSLVLKPEDFTEEEKDRIYRVLQSFSDRSFDHSLIIMMKPRQKSSGLKENYMRDSPSKESIRKCNYRYLKMEDIEQEESSARFNQIVNENNGEHVSYREFEERTTFLLGDDQTQNPPTSRSAAAVVEPKSGIDQSAARLNSVSCGRSGAGKTSAAKAIVGQTDSCSASNQSECVRKQGEVCGRWVSVVESPALYGKAQQEVMEESFRCISLCDPEGVHAFISVLPVGPLTDEDKGELQTIQDTFSSRVNDFIIILFTVNSDPTAPPAGNFVEENKDIQELCQSCGGRYVVMNIRDRQKVPESIEMVETMMVERSSFFSKDTLTEISIERILKFEAELQDVKHKRKDDLQFIEQLRKEIEEMRKKKIENMKSLQAQVEEQRKQKAQQSKEKDEAMEKEREKRKKEHEEDEKKWKKQEESQRREWRQKSDTLESRVRVEREQREATEKKSEMCRRERNRERDAWDKEKDGIWERMHQESKENSQEMKKNSEEERTSHRKSQEEFYQKRKKWTYSCFTLVLFVCVVLLYVYSSR